MAKQKINADNINYQILLEETKQETRKANARLRNMEKKGYSDTNAVVIAQQQIKKLNGEDKNRYSATKKMSYNDLEKQLKSAKKFNQSKGSTIKGMKETIEKRSNSFIYKGADPNSLTKLYNFMNTKEFSQMSELYGSNQVLDLMISLDVTQMSKTDFKTRMKKVINDTKGLYSDELYLEDLEKVLKEKPKKRGKPRKEV